MGAVRDAAGRFGVPRREVVVVAALTVLSVAIQVALTIATKGDP